jgi:carbamoyl-phosphate synthase small subunit
MVTAVDNGGLLVLADGTTFEGVAIGHRPDSGATAGEVVFNTALVGYQEIVTDPSYAGQIITFTYPHIGNYGVNGDDNEAHTPNCRGVIVRDLARRASNWRATEDLQGYLDRHGVAGIAGIDTRRLTRHIRAAGAMPGAFGVADRDVLLAAAQADGGTDGRDLVADVTTDEAYSVGPDDATFSVVAYDFGIKRSILDQLVHAGCRVDVVPAATPAPDVLQRNPDGVFLSNGPGDPTPVAYAHDNVRALLGKVPVFGICLGHQSWRWRSASRFKLPFRASRRPIPSQPGPGVGSPARTTTTQSTASLRGDVTHLNSDGDWRACGPTCALACSTTRGGSGPRRATCSGVHRPHAGGLTCAAPTSRPSC